MIEDRIDLVFGKAEKEAEPENAQSEPKLDAYELSEQVKALKLLLEEQQRANLEAARQATMESLRSAQEHQKELEKTRAEAEKARADTAKIRQQAAQAAQQAAGELRRVENEFSNARGKLPSPTAAARAPKRSEIHTDPAGKIKELENELKPAKKSKESRRAKFALQIAAWLLLGGGIAAVGTMSISNPARNTTATAPEPVETKTPFAKAIERTAIAAGLEPESAKLGSAFVRSVDRLGRAFESFPSLPPSQIVKEVNRTHPGSQLACPMEWNTVGDPVFVLGGGQKIPPSLVGAINGCASLVEQYRQQTLKASR